MNKQCVQGVYLKTLWQIQFWEGMGLHKLEVLDGAVVSHVAVTLSILI